MVPPFAFEGSQSEVVGHQNHVHCPRAGCAAVIGGGMLVLEKGHVVAWLRLADAEEVGAGHNELEYFVAVVDV